MNVNNDLGKPVKTIEQVTKVSPKRILAPIDLDGSEADATDYAIKLAEHYDADLWLMPITKELGIVADMRGLSSYVHDSWSHRLKVRLWDLVLEARQRHFRTFPVSACCGNRSEQILKVAARLKVDLIILRVHGHGHSFAGLTQSQADAVLRHADSPIIMTTAHGHSPSAKNLNLDKK
ncbi:MAG: universal stress protein [Chthoniobacterales bacterium]